MRRATMKEEKSGAEGRKRRKFEAEEVIDLALQSQIEKERPRWRDILKRILVCTKYLVTQNLAVRGHGESLQLDDVCGEEDFLGLLKLLAVSDPVTKEHLRYVERHPRTSSYLSPGIQDEFIHMMASTVRQSLLRGIRKAKYYGLMFDTAPDLAHRDQMSVVARYMEIDLPENTARVRESFLGFIQISPEDAVSSAQNILKRLEEDGMDLQDCRSQCYDNSAMIAGHGSESVNQRICEKNPLALLVNWDNHSLNLVGLHAAKQDPVMVTFFATIDNIYQFFSQSTQRWEKLQSTVPEVVKSESETRCCAQTEAVKPVSKYVEEILELLYNMAYTDDETHDTKGEAETLYNRMLTYEFLTLLGFWNRILIRINQVQKRLQDPKMNFHDSALDLKALRDHFLTEREVLVGESLERGFGLCEEWDVEVERRVRCRKTTAGEQSRDAGLTAKQQMERVMKETLDRLHREMDERFTRLHDTDTKFGFLLDTQGLCYSKERVNLKNNCETFA